MLLVLDVGNTNTAIGLYKGEELLNDWRLATDRYRTADEWGQLITTLLHMDDRSPDLIRAVAVACVVPPLESTIERTFKRYFDLSPFFITHEVDLGIENIYDNPAEVGADRLVNAVGALHRHGCPVIIIDFGTATTFDLVNCDRQYVGGVICPGIGISSKALFEKAAKLPRVDLVKPDKVVGTTTVKSMQSGLFFGYLEQVRGIISRIKQEIGKNTIVVTTGGQSRVFGSELGPDIIRDSNLTLEGMRLIYERNRGK
jgi:type III pantothenate kinase